MFICLPFCRNKGFVYHWDLSFDRNRWQQNSIKNANYRPNCFHDKITKQKITKSTRATSPKYQFSTGWLFDWSLPKKFEVSKMIKSLLKMLELKLDNIALLPPFFVGIVPFQHFFGGSKKSPCMCSIFVIRSSSVIVALIESENSMLALPPGTLICLLSSEA